MEKSPYEALVAAKKPDIAVARVLAGATVDSITAAINQKIPTSRASVHRFLTGAPVQLSRARSIAEVLGKPVTELFEHVNGDPIENVNG